MSAVIVEFVRCACGAEYGHRINLLDDKPVWTRPKVKRGGCKHDPADAEMLVAGRWLKSGDPVDETDSEGDQDG